jgi:two-component sensor histidine kinase
LSDIQTFLGVENVGVLAKAIVDTVVDLLVVLDGDLRVITASRSFYLSFQVDRQETQGRLLYELGDGQWNIPKLKMLLEKSSPDQGVMEGYEVDREFPGIGRRTMLLSARKVFYEAESDTTILLIMEDVTKLRAIELAMQELMRQKDVLLKEMEHRVANSLALIASILLLKAGSVQSEETRRHLQDAHRRVMSVAAVQTHLHLAGTIDSVEMAPYLTTLCESLADSIIGDSRPVSLKVHARDSIVTSDKAVSIGLIVTELVINALKHAFPVAVKEAHIVVTYETAGTNWRLSISDDGIGGAEESVGRAARKKAGLGTSVVSALAQQLDAQVEVLSGPTGTIVSIAHATFSASREAQEGWGTHRASQR